MQVRQSESKYFQISSPDSGGIFGAKSVKVYLQEQLPTAKQVFDFLANNAPQATLVGTVAVSLSCSPGSAIPVAAIGAAASLVGFFGMLIKNME